MCIRDSNYTPGSQMRWDIRRLARDFYSQRELLQAFKGSAFTPADIEDQPQNMRSHQALLRRLNMSKA